MKLKARTLLAAVLMCSLVLNGCGGNQAAPEVPEGSQEIEITNAEKVETSYDCIVVDGSPEGISAAISAARNGLKTLLICQDAALGGLYTLGELNFIDVPESRSGQVLVGGIYKEFSDAVGGSGFDIIKAKNVFYQMVANEKNLTLRVNSHFRKPLMDGQTITGVQVEEEGKSVEYHAPVVIDATPDGTVCAAADVPYTFAGEDIGERDREMGVTLVFRLRGVDWDKVSAHVTKIPKGETTAEGDVNGNLAWGYSKEGFAYEPTDEAMRLRGFNIARQDNGDVLLNALIIFDVDALNPESRAEGIARGEAELPMIIEYMRAHCEGFEQAELVNTAEQLYVRETRHIECEKMLTIDDVLENRAQPDAICVTNYPVDVQATKTQRFGTVVGFPDQYEISFASLVPKKIDGLMIVGRSAGFTSLAAVSARIVPTGMACGQAAGVAAKLCVDKGMTPRELCDNEKAIKKMQTDFVPLPVHIPGQKIMQEMLDEEVCKICGRPAKKHSDAWNFMLHRLEEYQKSLEVNEDEEVEPFYKNNYIVELQKRDTSLNDNLAEITKLRHKIQEVISYNNRLHDEVKKIEANLNVEIEQKKRILAQTDGLSEEQLLSNYENISNWMNQKIGAENRIAKLKEQRAKHRKTLEESQDALGKLAEGTSAAVFAKAASIIRQISEAFKSANTQ